MSMISGGEPPVEDPDAVERRLRLLYEAGRRLSRSLDPRVLFRTLTDLVKEVMSCDGLLVSSYTPTDDHIRCEYAWADGHVLDHAGFPAIKLSRNGGMQSQVILQRRARMFDVPAKVKERPDNYQELSDAGGLKVVEEEPETKSALMCPMMLDDNVTGVVQVMSDKVGAYDFEDLQLLQALVHQLSPAIHNSQLYTQLKAELETREAAERALAESEQRFRTLVDSLPLIAWATNPQSFQAEYTNKYYYEYTGLHPTVPGHDGWDLVVHPEDRAKGLEKITHCFENGITWEQEIRLKAADGAYRWHLSRMVPLRNADGETLLWLGSSTDIHAQKEAEAELEARVMERTRELELAIRELEGFTYSVSHDLRAPLRSIVATSVMLQQDYAEALPDEAAALLVRQSEAARNMALLIDDLLHLSRITRQEMHRTSVDLSQMAAEIVDELRAEGAAGTAEIVVEPGVTAHADPRLIRLALMNLFANAAKFSPGGGRITFGHRDGRYFVKDEGIGFDMAYVDRLFRPFERLVSTKQFPGTGIGLANVKRIIERHGGLVWAEAEPGSGATFSFTLG